MYEEKKAKNGTSGIRTPLTGVAARNAADCAMQALDRCGLLHEFNPLLHAATIINNVTWYTFISKTLDKPP